MSVRARVLVRPSRPGRQHLFGSLRWNGMEWKGECGEKEREQITRYGGIAREIILFFFQ